MTMNRKVDKIHTTIGELVVALSEAAFEVCAEKRDAYFLVALALKHLLRRTQRDKAADKERATTSERVYAATGCSLSSLQYSLPFEPHVPEAQFGSI
jgi:hypothetical protein